MAAGKHVSLAALDNCYTKNCIDVFKSLNGVINNVTSKRADAAARSADLCSVAASYENHLTKIYPLHLIPKEVDEDDVADHSFAYLLSSGRDGNDDDAEKASFCAECDQSAVLHQKVRTQCMCLLWFSLWWFRWFVTSSSSWL